MKLLSLSCNECGAPLEVPDGTKFVTCGYCSARLTVQHTSNAVYTEVLEKIGDQTERIADNVETLKLQNQLERLDREWTRERTRHMVRGKRGKHEPGGADVIGAFVIMGIGLAVIICTLASGAPVTAIVGVVLVGLGIFSAASNATKASAYAKARGRYQQQRRELIAQINAQDSRGAGDSPLG